MSGAKNLPDNIGIGQSSRLQTLRPYTHREAVA